MGRSPWGWWEHTEPWVQLRLRDEVWELALEALGFFMNWL